MFYIGHASATLRVKCIVCDLTFKALSLERQSNNIEATTVMVKWLFTVSLVFTLVFFG